MQELKKEILKEICGAETTQAYSTHHTSVFSEAVMAALVAMAL